MSDEREFTCAGCGGDGCLECAERGFYCADFEPVTLEDLDEWLPISRHSQSEGHSEAYSESSSLKSS